MQRPCGTAALATTVVLLFCITVTSGLGAPGQTPSSSKGTLAFETVSIKQSTQSPVAAARVSPDRFRRRLTTVLYLMTYAFNTRPLRIQGLPDWGEKTRFDVEAKASGPSTVDEMRTMVRELLKERFNLQAHIESREVEFFALVKARGDGRLGDKLRPSAVDCAEVRATRGVEYRPRPEELQPGEPRCIITARPSACCVSYEMPGEPLSRIVEMMETYTGRLVVDKTGLTGTFDIDFETSRFPSGLPNSPDQQSTIPDGPSVATALRDQLGLKLESERGLVEFLVIDHLDPPTPD